MTPDDRRAAAIRQLGRNCAFRLLSLGLPEFALYEARDLVMAAIENYHDRLTCGEWGSADVCKVDVDRVVLDSVADYVSHLESALRGVVDELIAARSNGLACVDAAEDYPQTLKDALRLLAIAEGRRS